MLPTASHLITSTISTAHRYGMMGVLKTDRVLAKFFGLSVYAPTVLPLSSFHCP